MSRMKILRILVGVFALFGVLAFLTGMIGLVYFLRTGISARAQPGPIETFVAGSLRDFAIGRHARHYENPEPDTEEVRAEGMAHFADHCASCHANDGSGNTEMGRGLYPRVPDLRLPATQELEDHELFYIIENGIRLTGMPAWGNGTRESEDASWRLVRFIRHLPRLTPEEIERMEAMNPRSPQEIRQEIEEERFLRGEDSAPVEPPAPHKH